MSVPADQFKINLNQNLWGLLLTFTALGAAEHYHLCTLFWLSSIASVVMPVSVTITTTAYTSRYWKDRMGA